MCGQAVRDSKEKHGNVEIPLSQIFPCSDSAVLAFLRGLWIYLEGLHEFRGHFSSSEDENIFSSLFWALAGHSN